MSAPTEAEQETETHTPTANASEPMTKSAPESVSDRPRRPSLLRLAITAVVIIVAFTALAGAGVRARNRQQTDRDAVSLAVQTDKPRVLITKAEKAPTQVEQILPGTASPLLDTAVYARTSGYLRRWLVDIGDRVAEGQLLAEIDTPEVDAQLLQARATLSESRATLVRNKASAKLAHLNLDRIRQTVARGVGSQQDLDEADAALNVAEATIQVTEATIGANEANVKRLAEIQSFQKVTAPFKGVVTARNYDPGALIVADNAATKELFHLARMDTLRVFADVPQTFATAIRTGQAAPVSRREIPGKEFQGVVTRTTSAVDPLTRTLRVEVDVPNPDRELLPGMYLQVRFKLDSPSNAVWLPGAAITTRADGAKVALLDAGNTVHYRAVTTGRDYGTVIEVTNGLAGGETVVVRPGDDLADGTIVEPVSAESR
jgi:RND family efflux transporter MFP subunit